MEEVVTIDGRQFRLTTDRPLTEIEKTQTIAEIRKQSGCGCGSRVVNMDPDWQYGGVQSLTVGTCTTVAKPVGSTVTLSAQPAGGIANYTVRFWKKVDALAIVQQGVTASGVAENAITTTTYTVAEGDVTASTGDTTALMATGASTVSGAPTFAGGAARALAAGVIRFYTTVVDSCPTGPNVCVQECDVTLVCVAPTCNFIVT